MWTEEEDLPTAVRKTLRPPWREIYDLLEKRGLVEKPPGEDVVTQQLEGEGWRCEDVSTAKCGWDITARRRGQERHVEVKGVSGAKSAVLLTRHEVVTAQTDPQWCLTVVTQALSKELLHEYSATDAVDAAVAYVYRADLS